LLLAACQPAAPPDSVQAASAAAHKAADQLVAMAQASAGQPPRQTDAAAGPLLDAVFNTAPLQGAAAPYSDFPAIDDWLASTQRLGEVYLLAGTGQTASTASGANAAAQARIEQNALAFAPEFGRYLDAGLVVESAEAATLAPYLAANPNATIAQAADGGRTRFAETAQSAIQTIGFPNFSSDWREARARALVSVAPRFAAFLTDAQKQSLSAAALQGAASTTDPQQAALLNQFAAAIVAKPAS